MGMRQSGDIPGVVRTLQIIDLTMVTAIVSTSVIFTVLKKPGLGALAHTGLGAQSPVLTFVGAGLAGMAAVVAFGLQRILDGNAGRRAASENEQNRNGVLFRAYIQRNIMTAAVLEGAALLSLVAYAVEARPVSLVAAGIMAAGIGLQIPSVDRLTRWIDGRSRPMD